MLTRHPNRSYVLLPLALVFACLVAGTVGFMLIEGWPALDSLYMTVTTLTTVGFGEVHPLSSGGRVFTMLLIVSGVGIAAYSLSSGAQAVVRGELRQIRRIRRMEEALRSMDNHTIVCGMGRLGRAVVRELEETGQRLVLIDSSADILRSYEERGIPCIVGTATKDEILTRAGIERARSLLTMLPDDADNVYVTLCARALNARLKILSRTESESSEMTLRRAGADHVFFPYRVTGTRIANTVVRPNVSDFLELTSIGTTARLLLEEITVPNDSPLIGKSLGDSNLRRETGAVIAAIISSGGAMKFNPGADDNIEAGSTLIVFGEKDCLNRMARLVLKTG